MKTMKRMLTALLALVMLLSLSCTAALAAGEEESADPTDPGIYGLTEVPAYADVLTLEALKPNKDTVAGEAATVGDADVIFHKEAEQVKLTFTGATAGKYYMVFGLSVDLEEAGRAVPIESDIQFVDQAVNNAGTVSCNIYPMKLTVGQTYHIYLSSNESAEGKIGALTKVGSFTYYAPEEPYTLGDINNDGRWNSTDALLALQIGAGLYTYTETEYKAANVNGDATVNSVDALMILQYGAGLITSWDN